MKYASVDKVTNEIVRADQLPADGGASGEKIKWQFLPRIKCNDCPGKLYTVGPGTSVDNFEIHLKNRQHKDRVLARTKAGPA